MRIVGGKFRGRPLAAPAHEGTRPTSDRVREAVFNILLHGIPDFSLPASRCWTVRRTGALGLEALSRGPPSACSSRRTPTPAPSSAATSSLRPDRRHQDLPPRCHRSRPAGNRGEAGLVFLDPPYAQGLAERALLAQPPAAGWCPAPSPSSRNAKVFRLPCPTALPCSIAAPGAIPRSPLRKSRRAAPKDTNERTEDCRCAADPISGWIEAGIYVFSIGVLGLVYASATRSARTRLPSFSTPWSSRP
jgi:16S rRNA (guanine966-N2)-methyltransferase